MPRPLAVLAVVLLALLVVYLALMGWARRAPRPATLGLHDGRLAPLPPTPNAVSTATDDPARRMNPLPFVGDLHETHDAIIDVLRRDRRAAIVTDEAAYIHAEFRTPLIGFIDDVEFHLDADARVVGFRSASRLGHSDLGANRQRMERIAQEWNRGRGG